MKEVRERKAKNPRAVSVLHLFAGGRREGDVEWWLRNLLKDMDAELIMLSIDLERGPQWDLNNPRTIEALGKLAEEGLIDVVLRGPPCST